MDPVFTLQWPEFVLADRLQKMLPKSEGFSVFIPLSRQEKGIDLAVMRKMPNGDSRVATIQVKASRTYTPERPKKTAIKRYSFYTWFNCFEVPDVADFILLFGMYAPDGGRTTLVGPTWYKDCTLMFSSREMRKFMSDCLTVKGTPDSKFAFGFDGLSEIIQTRGDKNRQGKNFTDYLLDKRIPMLREKLGA